MTILYERSKSLNVYLLLSLNAYGVFHSWKVINIFNRFYVLFNRQLDGDWLHLWTAQREVQFRSHSHTYTSAFRQTEGKINCYIIRSFIQNCYYYTRWWFYLIWVIGFARFSFSLAVIVRVQLFQLKYILFGVDLNFNKNLQ